MLLLLIQTILPKPPLQPMCNQIYYQITLSKRLWTCEMNRTNKTHTIGKRSRPNLYVVKRFEFVLREIY